MATDLLPTVWGTARMRADELELRVCADVADGDGVVVVHLVGELDLASAGRLRAALHHLYREGTTSLVLDLSRLAFVDSTGVVGDRGRLQALPGTGRRGGAAGPDAVDHPGPAHLRARPRPHHRRRGRTF
jgi:STAS domain